MDAMDATLLTTVGTGIVAGFSWAAKLLTNAGKRWYEELKARTDACDKDRADLRENQEKIMRDLDIFKSCSNEPCGARGAFQRRANFESAQPK